MLASSSTQTSRRSFLLGAPAAWAAGSSLFAKTAPPAPYGALPSETQIAWSELEFYNFLHFTVNTFTDKEWGYDNEDPAIFNPAAFDAGAIIETLKANPGKWALVISNWKTTAAPAAFRQAGCEATTRRNEDKKPWSVYVRYPLKEAKVRTDAGQTRKSQEVPAVAAGTALRPPAPSPQATPRR